MLYRVALQGFAESERRSLASLLRETAGREPGYQVVHRFADADVILADGDSAPVVANVVDEARISTTLFIGEHRPPEATRHVARPTHPVQVLRGLDDLVACLDHGLGPRASGAGNDAHAQAKAAARRARLAALATMGESSPIPPDVLVLDPGDTARNHLCALLEQFGFCAYPARNSSQALWLVETRRFRAAFLDIALDGSDGGAGNELCRRVKMDARHVPGSATALFIVSSQAQPVDRVRAALAGSDAFLVKPLARGDVAGALESCAVAMPADARRR